MDPNLLRLYNDELIHLREVGSEFAAEFPKIAGRLGMEGMEVADPYVERLLEGFAFLAARVQLKLDAEQPRLIAHLLEASYPNFLAPLPSMMITRFRIDPANPNLLKGHVVPRGAKVISEVARGQDTHCEFRTAHEVTLWPIELVDVGYFSYASDLPMARLPQAQGMQGGLRIRLRAGGGLRFDQIAMDALRFCIGGPDDVAFRVHELVAGHAMGTFVRALDGSVATPTDAWRADDSVRPVGFAADEALLPESSRAFSGHRLLQEISVMPRRLLFFEIGDLAARLARLACDEVEFVVFFDRGDASLEALVDQGTLSLFCTPAINLLVKRVDPVLVGPESWEHHVVPDGKRPMDFEVHSLVSVTGFGTGSVARQEFLPLYATDYDMTRSAAGAEGSAAHGYYTVRREPRLLSPRQKQQGTRSAHIGEEIFLSLTDPRHRPYQQDIRQLSITALVTNRDLPTLLPRGPQGSGSSWKLDPAGPVTSTEAIHGPTRPVTRRPVGELGWNLVSHLSLNHRSLVGESPERAASVLRRTLELYAPPGDRSWLRQVDGIQALDAQSVVRRLPFRGPLTFGTGVSIVLDLDELAYQGTSAYLFASVIEFFLARHAAINTFTQLTLRTSQRGEVKRWRPRTGMRATL